MGVEDKDFILRQTKQLAQIMAALIGKKESEELLNFGVKQADDKDRNGSLESYDNFLEKEIDKMKQ